ncbi:MAG TPA: flagellar basal body-associated FliL family protein [Anaeromyxobacteraceae bacterium]|nr:flagellar basal body-associated FliL family protein [Anaeromyxobacteraceae bacterium]
MSEKTEKPTTPDAPAAAGGSKLMVALTGLNSLLLVGVLAVALLRPAGRAGAAPSADADHASAAAGATHDATGAAGAEAAAAGLEGAKAGPAARPGPMLALPDFVVHLRDPDTDRYARLTLNLELEAESAKETLNAHLPQIRDAFIAYLSDRTVEELRGSEGMGVVKQDLAKKLHELVPSAPVKALYVTDIVVQ